MEIKSPNETNIKKKYLSSHLMLQHLTFSKSHSMCYMVLFVLQREVLCKRRISEAHSCTLLINCSAFVLKMRCKYNYIPCFIILTRKI